LITGSNTGIGLETAKVLSQMGANIYLACRDRNRVDAAKDIVKGVANEGHVNTVLLDLGSFESIQETVKFLKKEKVVIDILINNAGVMAPPYMETRDGFESQIGVNHLGHFYLTLLMFDEGLIHHDGRIINLSSIAHRRGQDIDVENLLTSRDDYKATVVYGESKLSNVLFSLELAKRLSRNGYNAITCSLHPGGVRTELGRFFLADSKLLSFLQYPLYPLLWLFMKSPLEGAQTSLHCSLSDDIVPGAYYSDCKLKQAQLPENYEQKAVTLWETSERLIGYNSKLLK